MNKSRRKQILDELKTAFNKEEISSSTFIDLQDLLSSKIGLSFEMMEDDIYKNHIDAGKYVFLKDHKKEFPHQFNNQAKTFGSVVESDNLLALFLLQNTHKNEVDLIFIDPPYNVGSGGFIYNNDYRIKKEDRGLIHVKKESNYRHSKWLSIMKIRLEYARKLLKTEGLIVISIDDNELYHLKLLMDDVFSPECYKGTLIWHKGVGMLTAKNIRKDHEYVLIYEKTHAQSKFIFKEIIFKIPKFIKRPLVTSGTMGKYTDSNNALIYSINCPKHKRAVWPKDASGFRKQWTISQKKSLAALKKNNISCTRKINSPDCSLHITRIKKTETKYFSSLLWNKENVDVSHLTKSEWPFSGQGAIDLKKDTQDIDLFDYPKPVKFLQSLFSYLVPKNGLVLDFFAGSGTTACAVAELNKEDDGSRQFLLVTNNDGDNKDRKNHCVFRDVLYKRLKTSAKKYDLSFKSFHIDNKSLDKIQKEETFYSRQNEYINTCNNLLSILYSKHDPQDFPNKENQKGKDPFFSINKLKYGFSNINLDVDMRFAFKLKKENKSL